jgi:hypothetical protein
MKLFKELKSNQNGKFEVMTTFGLLKGLLSTIYLVHHSFFVQLASICLGHVSMYLSKNNYHMGG